MKFLVGFYHLDFYFRIMNYLNSRRDVTDVKCMSNVLLDYEIGTRMIYLHIAMLMVLFERLKLSFLVV